MSKKVLVAIKRVVDYNVNIRVKSDESGVETDHVKMSMNPFDEIAVEEAIRMKEAGHVDEVVVVSIGTQASQETLRTALAIGADRAQLIETDETLCPLDIAKILQCIVNDEAVDLVILGKQTIDGDHNQTGQMLAGLLDWPQGTFASEIILKENEVDITREIDGGLETIALTYPCVLTTDLRLNEPRYASLPNIMKAKKKPLVITPLTELPVTLKQRQSQLKVSTPATRTAGIKVESVTALLDALREKGVLS